MNVTSNVRQQLIKAAKLTIRKTHFHQLLNCILVNIDYNDIINIRAITSRRIRFIKIMRYWDAVNRSYPKYEDFMKSIEKLESIDAIEIHERDRHGQISNTIYRNMNIGERFRYLFTPTDKLFQTVLERLEKTKEAIGLTITEKDYEEIIKEYYFSVLKWREVLNTLLVTWAYHKCGRTEKQWSANQFSTVVRAGQATLISNS